MHFATLLVAVSSISSTAIAAATASGCSINNGQNGVCISTGSCKSGGGKSEAGHCPGAADIQVHHLFPFDLPTSKI
jgi:lysozyme